MDLSSNNLTGIVGLSFIKNYKELCFLSLSYNKLSVVEEDGNHSYLEHPIIWESGLGLGLASCNLSYVPTFLMRQRTIRYLDLSKKIYILKDTYPIGCGELEDLFLLILTSLIIYLPVLHQIYQIDQLVLLISSTTRLRGLSHFLQ